VSKLRSTVACASGGPFDYSEVSVTEGILTLRVSSSGPLRPSQVFQNESGGHRWQRIPPSEKRGRVHTSTVTVAVLPDDGQQCLVIDERDLAWKTTKGSGPGGQNRNKRENCVVLTHKPTGITVRVDSKSQVQNRERALAELTERLQSRHSQSQRKKRNSSRQSQVGSGMRGDKVRTIRVRDGIVTDHRTGRKLSLKKYLRGELP
jgi:peptide chain release factor 1